MATSDIECQHRISSVKIGYTCDYGLQGGETELVLLGATF